MNRRGLLGMFAAIPFVPKALAAVKEKAEVVKDVATLASRTFETSDCMWTGAMYDEPEDFKP